MSSFETDQAGIAALIAPSIGYSYSKTNNIGNSQVEDANSKKSEENKAVNFSDLLRNLNLGSDVKRQDNLFSNFNQSLQRSPIEYQPQEPRNDVYEPQVSEPQAKHEPNDRGEENTQDVSESNEQSEPNEQQETPEQPQQENSTNDSESQDDTISEVTGQLEKVLNNFNIQLSTKDLQSIQAALTQLRESGDGEKIGQLLTFLRQQVAQEGTAQFDGLQKLATDVKDSLIKFGQNIIDTAKQINYQNTSLVHEDLQQGSDQIKIANTDVLQNNTDRVLSTQQINDKDVAVDYRQNDNLLKENTQQVKLDSQETNTQTKTLMLM